MKSRHLVLAITLLAATAAQAGAQAVQLRFAPTVGQVTRYRITSRTWSSADTTGAPATQSSLYQTQTILPMDGPNYVVKVVFDSTVMTGPGAGRDPLRGWAIVIHQDARGNTLSTDVTPAPGVPGFLAGMLGKSMRSSKGPNSHAWPEGAVSPGYTWADSMPMSVGTGRNAKQVMCHLTYRFERVEQQGGARVAVVSSTATSAGGEGCTGSGETVFDLDGSRVGHSSMDMVVATGGGQSHLKTLMETLP